MDTIYRLGKITNALTIKNASKIHYWQIKKPSEKQAISPKILIGIVAGSRIKTSAPYTHFYELRQFKELANSDLHPQEARPHQ